jgi:hypothetical protein
MSEKQKGRTNFYLFQLVQEKRSSFFTFTSSITYSYFDLFLCFFGHYERRICLRISSCVYQKSEKKIITVDNFILFFFLLL